MHTLLNKQTLDLRCGYLWGCVLGFRSELYTYITTVAKEEKGDIVRGMPFYRGILVWIWYFYRIFAGTQSNMVSITPTFLVLYIHNILATIANSFVLWLYVREPG